MNTRWRRILHLQIDTQSKFRLLVTLVYTIIQVLAIDMRYAWARRQNGWNIATLRELVDYPLMSVFGYIIGVLGNSLRIWSWLFLAYFLVMTLWVMNRVLADDGQAFTRAYYEDTLLRLAFNIAVVSTLAVGALFIHLAVGGKPPAGWKIALSAGLVPVWFAILLLMR